MIALLLTMATTRFHVVESAGRSWLVGPAGRPFLSFGVCVVDQGATAETYQPKNPGYAAFRSYTGGDEWAADTLSRLRSWGFNTVGAWSDDPVLLRQRADMVWMPILHMGSSAGAPWRDLWDPATVATMDKVAREGILAHGGDPRVAGYFSDNELGWWAGAMFEWGFRAGRYSRATMVGLLRDRYRGSWARLLRDFEPSGADSFGALLHQGRLFVRAGGDGMATVQAWLSTAADRYYSLCRSIVKRHDPGALYLGDRYISNYYPEVARAAGRYADVVSTNLNADWNDGTFARFYLPTLRRLTHRPILISEYYVAAKENRSGNRNDSSGFPVVSTQAERPRVFRRSTETLLGLPYVVGAHWFQYYDEPRNGRADGENYDMGLVDIDNRPYDELTRAARAIDLDAVHRRSGAPDRSVAGGVPRLKPGSVGDLSRWPRERAFLPPSGPAERGDAYLGWSGGALYLAVYWNEDRFGEGLYRGGKVPPSERARLEVRLRGVGRPIVARLGEGGAPFVRGATLVRSQAGVRNLAILRIPVLGSPRTISLDARLDTRGRGYGMRWRGRYAVPGLPRMPD